MVFQSSILCLFLLLVICLNGFGEFIQRHTQWKRLLAKANGYPRPILEWYLDGKLLKNSDAMTIDNYEDGSTSLNIKIAIPEHRGVYMCEATNRNGVDTTSTQLVVVPQEHTEGTSKSYRKPDWVVRMEQLKEQMQGTVDRSRSGDMTFDMNPNEYPPTECIYKSEITIKPLSVCPSNQKALLINDLTKTSRGKSLTNKHISITNNPTVTQSQTTCVSTKSIVFSTKNISFDNNINEFSVNNISNLDNHSQEKAKNSNSDSKNQAHLDIGSAASLGELSMGSDSVFISESDTVSDITSRRPSSYTINSAYLSDDQQQLDIIESHIQRAELKQVHFISNDSSMVTSEDEQSNDPPNFAQEVLSNYLSSHRNSISQVIEALSSLAQADITTEIEMAIEENKKQKQREITNNIINGATVSLSNINPIPKIEITSASTVSNSPVSDPDIDIKENLELNKSGEEESAPKNTSQKLIDDECCDMQSPEIKIIGNKSESSKNSRSPLYYRNYGFTQSFFLKKKDEELARASSSDDNDVIEYRRFKNIETSIHLTEKEKNIKPEIYSKIPRFVSPTSPMTDKMPNYANMGKTSNSSKNIKESTKIPLPIYQYSSTEELEECSPEVSPRAERSKHVKHRRRTIRSASVDRSINLTEKDQYKETKKINTRRSLPTTPRVSSPSPISPLSMSKSFTGIPVLKEKPLGKGSKVDINNSTKDDIADEMKNNNKGARPKLTFKSKSFSNELKPSISKSSSLPLESEHYLDQSGDKKRRKSSKISRADSLEEFLLLESVCMED